MPLRLLGWFSLAPGAAEAAVPATLPRGLGLPDGLWPVCALGVRDVAGRAVPGKPDHAFDPSSRLTGAVPDIELLTTEKS